MSTVNERKTFISYSRKDKDFALEFAREMKSAGYSVWLDQLDIPTGARWDDQVEKSLRECEVFLIILTPASVSSDNVKDEIGYAIDHGKRIMPILLENCDVPLRLRRFQYVDFTNVEFNEGIKRAKRLLETLLTEPSAPVMTRNPGLEPQKSSDRKVAPAPSLPPKNKPDQRRWVSIGVGLLMCAACFGVVGAIYVFRNTLGPLFPSQIPATLETTTPTATTPMVTKVPTDVPSPVPPTLASLTALPTNTLTQVPTNTFTLTPTSTSTFTFTPTIEPPVGSEAWRQQLVPLSDGTISSVLIVGQFRRPSDLVGMSLDDQRNILIVELSGRTNQSGGYYQSLDNDTLAGAGAMLVFVREAKIRTDETLKTLTDDDIRNIFIVEIFGRTGRTDLQGLTNIQLVHVALSLQW